MLLLFRLKKKNLTLMRKGIEGYILRTLVIYNSVIN